MHLKKYLSPTYLNLVYSNYEEDYINSFYQSNFDEIYQFLKKRFLLFRRCNLKLSGAF